MNSDTFYLVWWTDGDSTPESQLMGICNSKEDAKALVDKFPVFSLYITTEKTNDYGECI